MPGYIIARHSSILSNTGLCQATSSRGTAAFSATPAYAKLHHREAQHHSQQNRPMPSYIIARHSSILSNPGLCQATSSQGAASFSATPAYARLHHREAQQHLHQPRRMLECKKIQMCNQVNCKETMFPSLIRLGTISLYNWWGWRWFVCTNVAHGSCAQKMFHSVNMLGSCDCFAVGPPPISPARTL